MRRLFALLLVSVAPFACSKENNINQPSPTTGSGNEGTACTEDKKCASGLCLSGLCRKKCDTTSDCGAGSRCLVDTNSGKSGCSIAKEDTCATDSDCGAFKCGFDKKCRTPCTASNGCTKEGQYCVESSCFDKGETGKVAEAIQCIDAKLPPLFCDGAALTACNAPGKPGRETLATCDSAGLCDASVKASSSACQAAACKEGDKQCNAKTFQIEECNTDRTGFVPQQGAKQCASKGLCEIVLKSPEPVSPVTQKMIDDVKADCQANAICQRGICFEGNPYACNADKSDYAGQDECGSRQCDPTQAACVDLKIDPMEVSRAKYADFLSKGPPASVPAGCQWNKNYHPGDDDAWTPGDAEKNLPVVNVDWCDAYAYCASQNQRLCGKLGKDETVLITETDVESASDAGVSEWMNGCSSGGEYEFAYGSSYKSQSCHDSKGSSAGASGAPVAVDALALTCASPRTGYKALRNLLGNVAEWENACTSAVSAGGADDQCLARGGDFSTEFNQNGCSLGATNKSKKLNKRSDKSDKIGFRCCG